MPTPACAHTSQCVQLVLRSCFVLGIIIPAASAADSWLSQLWSSHPSDPRVHWGRQWVPCAGAARCMPAPGQFLHAMGMVQTGARGCSCLPRAGQEEPALPISLPSSLQQQVPPNGTSSPQYLTPPGEKGDIQRVFEGSWCGWGPLAKLGTVPKGAQPRAGAGQGRDTAPSELKARLEEEVPAQGKL